MNLLISIKRQLSLSVLFYLRFWARLQLKKNHPTIIGITGTSGKTSTCRSLEALLSQKFLVKATRKANSESGLPLNILDLSMNDYSLVDWLRVIILAPFQFLTHWPKYQIYIAEMAIDSPHSPKNMAYLLTIINPDIGIFLNASTVHAENFDNLAQNQDPKKRKEEIIKLIATEKGKLIQSLPSQGLAVLNKDDLNVVQFSNLTAASVITFGTNRNSDIRFIDAKQSLRGTSFIFQKQGSEFELTMKGYLLPDHYGYTFGATLTVADYFKITTQEAIKLLEENFTLPPGRSSLINGINNSIIIDSSYNSSLSPLLDFLDLLHNLTKTRKLALLGDMRELGKQTETDHLLAAEKIAQCCDAVFLVGPNMKKYVLPYLKDKRVRCYWSSTSLQAANLIKNELKSKDVLLVKGSQNEIFLESAIEQLMAEPALASKILCRRGRFWDEKRAKLEDVNKEVE